MDRRVVGDTPLGSGVMDPITTDPIRWGFLGTGKIAASFARDLALLPDATLAAVGSRSQESADRFAGEYAVPRAHAAYEALVADPDVDVVYVASPHSHHLEHARLALEAGKPVLVEKPLTLTAADAEVLLEAGRAADLFVMEAMWTACHPMIRALVDGLRSGRFGEPRQVHADLGFVVPPDATARMVDPALGAGALLDMGIYPLTLAYLTLGRVVEARAVARVNEQGYDEDVAIASRHERGGLAALTASMTSRSPRGATIATTEGLLELPPDFHHPSHVTWTPLSGDHERIVPPAPVVGTGLSNEAAEVMRCLREGLTESPLVPHAQTLDLLRLMDDLRAQIDVRYAADA